MARYLLLHAFPFDGTMWESVAARLRVQGHEVLAPDLRGFGSAPLGDRGPAIDVLVDDMLALLGDEPVAIAGCSMGGYVAQGIAARRPDLVAALALVDTKATADPDAARAHRERVAGLAEGGDDWSAGMIAGLLGETTRRTRPDVVATVELPSPWHRERPLPGPSGPWPRARMRERPWRCSRHLSRWSWGRKTR